MKTNHSTPAIQSDHFSLEHYAEVLAKAITLGYKFPTVSEMKHGAHSQGRFLLLRHDIDVAPRYALRMAQLEHSLGVRSSYFVLLHSLYYNPAAPPHWEALRQIVSMGFEVGLHYETDFFEAHGIDPLEGVLSDVAALENILHIKIASVSQHRPASSAFLQKLNEYYVDAYNHDLMHNVRYISDSGFKWRKETPLDILGTEERIHALLHPVTWTFGELDMAGTYRRASEEITAEISASFEDFISSTNGYLSKREQLDAARKQLYSVPASKCAP
ncbi:MAG: hypothetical protein LAN59_02945 [Acidobacteriia bacterium]|nr:hypothetical protein [Terriglobia bacterium]